MSKIAKTIISAERMSKMLAGSFMKGIALTVKYIADHQAITIPTSHFIVIKVIAANKSKSPKSATIITLRNFS